MFQRLEGEVAVLVSNGVYKDAELYTRDGLLFAKAFGGFVQLMADGSTSSPKTRINALSIERPLFKTTFGKLAISGEVPSAKPLEAPSHQKLLGAVA